MEIKFSVVIPVYNGEKFIAEAIESVLNQEVPAHEVIVIDDGSKDGTAGILETYKGRVLAKTIPNGGASNARNTGMAMASGNFIAFLDHDDIWFRPKLKKFKEAILRHPEVGLFCSDYVLRVHKFGNRLVKHYSAQHYRHLLNFDAPLREHPYKMLIREHFIGTPSAVVVKKNVADQAGPFKKIYQPSEDYDFWLRCAQLTRFMILSPPLIYKRTHDQNLSNDRLRTLEKHRQVLQNAITEHHDFIVARGLRKECLEALARCTYDLGNTTFETSRSREAFTHYWRGFLIRPTPSNGAVFFFSVLKKLVRLLTFDLLSRKTLTRGSR